MEGPLLEHLHKFRDIAWVGDQTEAAAQSHGEQAHGEREDVIERQGRHDMGFIGLDPAFQRRGEPGMGLQRGGDDIAMGQHCPLGQACCAARVLQKGHRVQRGRAGNEPASSALGQRLAEQGDLARLAAGA